MFQMFIKPAIGWLLAERTTVSISTIGKVPTAKQFCKRRITIAEPPFYHLLLFAFWSSIRI